MWRTGLIISLTFLITTQLNAQRYGNSLGLRFGNGNQRTIGLTYNQHLFGYLSAEGIFQSDFSRNTTAHALIKQHQPIFGKFLNIYVGTGLSMGREESIVEDEQTKQLITTYDNATIGADVILGAELTLLGLNVSLDYKPNINLIGRENWYDGQVGFSVRKVLISYKDLKKKRKKKQRIKRREARREQRNEDY